MSIIIETTLGNITVDLYTTVRPRTCTNFLKLAKLKYYNFSLIYNMKRDFCCQMGKNWDKNVRDKSYFVELYGKNATKFENEKDRAPRIKHHKMGQISMVSDKRGYHSCQFIIILGEDERQLSYLDQCGHAPFGECVIQESFDTLEKINEALVDEEDRPYDDIRIVRMNILYDPFPDSVDVPMLKRALSPPPVKKLLKDYRMPKHVPGFDDEDDINDIDNEYEEKRDANQRAAILEMVGDLPNKDVTPDDNVLFVCKLNPCTMDEDLEIIFGKFGDIKSCDIIRDQKTGDSLQYAFIEFDQVESCENAYLKMDNVLIDERRIHVDFSQSVAKKWWRWRKNGKYQNVNIKTTQYLEDLNMSEEPNWKGEKVNYMNKWAQDAKSNIEKTGYIKKEEPVRERKMSVSSNVSSNDSARKRFDSGGDDNKFRTSKFDDDKDKSKEYTRERRRSSSESQNNFDNYKHSYKSNHSIEKYTENDKIYNKTASKFGHRYAKKEAKARMDKNKEIEKRGKEQMEEYRRKHKKQKMDEYDRREANRRNDDYYDRRSRNR